MHILGIDPSLRSTGICIMEDDIIILSQVIWCRKTPQDNIQRMERIYNIVKQVCELCGKNRIDLIAIERTYFMANRSAVVISLSELIGAIKLGLYIKSKAVPLEFTVAEARKLVLGKAYKKERVDAEMIRQGLPKFDDDNIRDAYILASAAKILIKEKP